MDGFDSRLTPIVFGPSSFPNLELTLYVPGPPLIDIYRTGRYGLESKFTEGDLAFVRESPLSGL
jgi:hypothetical protein